MSVVKSVFVFAASAVALAAWSEDEAVAESEETAKPAAGAKTAVVAKSAFTLLPLCRLVEGEVSARQPNGEWAAVEEGKFYPLGTSFRAGASGKVVVAFGPEATVTAAANSEFGTRSQTFGEATRKIVLVAGTVDVKLPDNLPEGAFFVSAPGFMVKNPAGESRYEYAKVGDGDRAVVRCVTGAMAVEGRHFDIPAMRAADEFGIDTSSDNLVTEILGRSGDFVIMIDQGVAMKSEVDDSGDVKEKAAKAVNEWRLSPATRVRITRSMPSIGERMSVHTLCFDASGERRSECSFCEGRAEINSGELMPREEKSHAEVAKKAAEAATEEAEVDEDEEKQDNKKESEASSEE